MTTVANPFKASAVAYSPIAPIAGTITRLNAASRSDAAYLTSGSPVVNDTTVTAADTGRPVSGAGIPAGSYVGTVTAGTSFRLSSSPSAQVDVNATAGARSDSVGTTSGSNVVTDASVLASDFGRPVSSAGIPAGSYVGTVTAGTSFLLTSTPLAQRDVTATATATGVAAIVGVNLAIGGPLAVVLPALSGLNVGALYPVQKDELDTSPNVVTVQTATGDTFDTGSTTALLRVAGSMKHFQAVTINSTRAWKIVHAHDPMTSIPYVPAGGALASTAGGNKVVFLGDSQTIGADVADTSRNSSWPNYLSIQSKQQAAYSRNAGVYGNTTAQMLSRFDLDVTPYAPSVVTLLAGRNDIGQGVTLSVYQANIVAILAKIRAIGAAPVLCTIPPTSGSGGVTTALWNAWLRSYAAANAIALLDFYEVLVDPATGNYLSSYNSGDNIHPNSAGYFALGAYATTKLAPLLPANAPLLPRDIADTANALYANCCFTNTTLDGNGEPSGWIIQNPSSTTTSIVTGDTTIKGNWFKMAFSSSSAQVTFYKTGLTAVVGHKYLFTGRVQSALSAGNLTLVVYNAGAAQQARYAVFQDVNALNGVFGVSWVCPASTTSLVVQAIVSASATGSVQLAQLAVWDLTAMGIDGLV